MSDFDLGLQQVVLNSVKSDLGGFTHDTVNVTWSATMKNGSIVDATGAELAVADAANAAGVIDDLTARNIEGDLVVGDTYTVAVAKRGLVLNEAVTTFSDAGIDAAGKAALEALNNKFATVTAA